MNTLFQENKTNKNAQVMHESWRDGRRINKNLVAEALNLVERAQSGDALAKHELLSVVTGRAALQVKGFKEVLTSSDFADYLGHGIDAMLLDAYNKRAQTDWRSYIHVGDSFSSMVRNVERYRITHGVTLFDETAEGEGLTYDNPTDLYYTFKPKLFTKGRVFSMHSIMSDDLGGLMRTPQDLLESALATEEWFASSLFVANTTLYLDTNDNGRPSASGTLPAGNRLHLELTAENLAIAFTQFSRFYNEDSLPIDNRPVVLVVPPALELTARQILNSAEIRPTGNTDARFPVNNPVQGLLRLVVNPYIPYVDSTYGNKSWYLFSDPSKIWAIDMSFYQGFERPFLFKQSATREPLSGQGSDAMMGDFNTGGVAFGCQHIIGGSHTNAVGGWRASIWSDGT